MATTTDAGTHHEVEIKLDAARGFVLPDLHGLPGVTGVTGAEVQQLEAVYLDSADLRLARHGTTFRRRTGGSDEGWHLKLPDAGNGRVEVRRSLGPSVNAVPPKLLGLVRVQLRGEPVGPVAKITTRRTVYRLLGPDDVVLAEVADDEVTGEAMGAELTSSSWRELEVELVEGDRALLAEAVAALVDAGAHASSSASKLQRVLAHRLAELSLPDVGAAAGQARKAAKAKAKAKKAEPTAGEVVVQYLTLNVAALIAEDPRVRVGEDEGVHQMRVAARRLRTALATFRPLFTGRPGDPLRNELKWLAGLLGVARDAEVMRARLRTALDEQPPELVLGPVRRRVDLELGQAFKDGHRAIVEALDGDRYLALVAALEALVADPPFSARGRAPASEELRKRVRKAGARVQRAAAGLDGLRDQTELDHHLHEVRIAAKRARYAAEAVRPVAGKPAKAVATRMEQIQETLGDHQDAVVERQWLRDLAVRAFLAGENAFTFGRLHALTEFRAGHDREQFAGVWAATRKTLATWPG